MSELDQPSRKDVWLSVFFGISGFIAIPLTLALGTPDAHPLLLATVLMVCGVCLVLAQNKLGVVLTFVAFMAVRMIIAAFFYFAGW